MKKTSVYLSDEDTRRLSWLADREGVPQAEIIRRAIAAYAPAVYDDRNFRLIGSGEGPGDSVANIPEEELLRGFGSPPGARMVSGAELRSLLASLPQVDDDFAHDVASLRAVTIPPGDPWAS